MTAEEFKNLEAGDIVQNEGSENVYIVVLTHDRSVALSRILIAMNPSEWKKINA